MSKTKAADEIFCRSCGEPIKKEAEICPECGVRNNKSMSSSAETQTPSPGHDPSKYETTVSDTWWYGVAGGIAAWILALILSSTTGGSGAVGTFSGLVVLVAWIGMPVAAYFDMQYIRANGKWNPSTVIWVVLLAIWLVNILAGAVYLYRRHEVLGEP